MRTSVTLDNVGGLIEGRSENPNNTLGPHTIDHQGRKATAIRAYLPNSQQAWVLHSSHKTKQPMRKIHPEGLFEAICPFDFSDTSEQYQLQMSDDNGQITTMHDPYAFPTIFSDYDLHLLGEGTHWKSYDKLGAHVRTVNGVKGVHFAVWAPNALGISIVGEFNHWDGRTHQMRKLIPSGIWELFVPDIEAGCQYKFRVTQHDRTVDKCDPYGFSAEVPPRTASVVADLDSHEWNDGLWMEQREQNNQLEQPISVYEVHLGSWKKKEGAVNGWFNYRELAHMLVDYCHKMNYTHLELMPISEHPFSGSWGYQTVGYFSVTSRHGTPEDFMYFVDYCHQSGIGVFIDWVPAHFPKDDHGLRMFDGTHLYEHQDPRMGEHPDWGTLIFNYGRTEVRNFLISNALFWLDKYHIDGLRVDAVASMLYLDYSREHDEWVPNEHGGRENLDAVSLLKDFNEQTHIQYPGVLTIAEESTSWEGVSRPTYTGGLGFSLKWNMGWMNDTLSYMRKEPVYRQHHHGELTFSLIYAFTENFSLPLSHDEVVHGKGSLITQMPGDHWQKFANLRLLYSYMWTHPGKKLLFMGCELAQWKEWNHDAEIQWELLEWDTHQGIQQMVSDLNAMYRHERSLYEVDFESHGFEWIVCDDWQNSVLVYIRKAKDPKDFLVVCCNMTPVVRDDYRIGVPNEGSYSEIFNSDNARYCGSNVLNEDDLHTEHHATHGQSHSLRLTLPPLSTVVLKPNS